MEKYYTQILYSIIVLLLIFLIIQHFRFSSQLKKERKDAVKRSKAVIGGQAAEQLAPYLPHFPANPCDARFIGKPVDFVVFSGLGQNDTVDEILFVEVKTGEAKLSDREKQIKKAVNEGRVRYVEYKI